MGRRGPAPAPTALKLVKGERRDRINRNEPIPRDGELQPPEPLDGDALEVWRYTLDELTAMRLAKPIDRDALFAYCQTVVIHRRCTRLLRGSDVLLKGRDGTLVRNPLVAMQRDAATLMKSYAAEFGLTPRARSELKTSEAAHGDSKRRLLSS